MPSTLMPPLPLCSPAPVRIHVPLCREHGRTLTTWLSSRRWCSAVRCPVKSTKTYAGVLASRHPLAPPHLPLCLRAFHPCVCRLFCIAPHWSALAWAGMRLVAGTVFGGRGAATPPTHYRRHGGDYTRRHFAFLPVPPLPLIFSGLGWCLIPALPGFLTLPLACSVDFFFFFLPSRFRKLRLARECQVMTLFVSRRHRTRGVATKLLFEMIISRLPLYEADTVFVEVVSPLPFVQRLWHKVRWARC